MRRLVLACLVLACKQDRAQVPVPTAGSAGSALPAKPPAPPDAPISIELLHAVPARVQVSSRVANPAILPRHLVDRDLGTAWNSATGDLVGAWMKIELRAPAVITELRMTVGHTGKGPNGEDYFTMNPRIKTVSVLHDKTVLATLALDPGDRALQRIPLPTGVTDHVRVRIDAVVPGSKPAWREACVSELEAWGHPTGATTVKPSTPFVEVGPPVDEPLPRGPIVDPAAFCALLTKAATARYRAQVAIDKQAWADCARRHDPGEVCGNTDTPGPPECELAASATIGIGPWLAAGTVEVSSDPIYGEIEVQPAVQTERGWWLVGSTVDCGHFSDRGACKLAIAGTHVRNDELVLDYTLDGASGTEHLTVTCTVDAAKLVTCSAPVATRP
jgi:hypothetical protein